MRNYINFLLSKAGEKLFTKKDSSFDFECKDVNCPHCLEDIRQIVEDEEEDYVNNLKTNNMRETLEQACKRYYEENIDQSNIPREHYEWEIQELMSGFCAEFQAEKRYSEEDIMMVIERVIYLTKGWTPEGFSFYRDNNQIKEEIINLLKDK